MIRLRDARVTQPLNGKTLIQATMGRFLPRYVVTSSVSKGIRPFIAELQEKSNSETYDQAVEWVAHEITRRPSLEVAPTI